ncbi:MAG: hypothetical protein Q8Q90_00870 [bacterium]|nr:hypothetical protein [bacterium]
MGTVKSLEFWVVMLTTIAVGSVTPFIAPILVGAGVMLLSILVITFYVREESGKAYLSPVFTKMGLFMGYDGGSAEYPEKPGPIFRGIGIGSIVSWLVISIVGYYQLH